MLFGGVGHAAGVAILTTLTSALSAANIVNTTKEGPGIALANSIEIWYTSRSR
jgi:hypothetical protein